MLITSSWVVSNLPDPKLNQVNILNLHVKRRLFFSLNAKNCRQPNQLPKIQQVKSWSHFQQVKPNLQVHHFLVVFLLFVCVVLLSWIYVLLGLWFCAMLPIPHCHLIYQQLKLLWLPGSYFASCILWPNDSKSLWSSLRFQLFFVVEGLSRCLLIRSYGMKLLTLQHVDCPHPITVCVTKHKQTGQSKSFLQCVSVSINLQIVRVNSFVGTWGLLGCSNLCLSFSISLATFSSLVSSVAETSLTYMTIYFERLFTCLLVWVTLQRMSMIDAVGTLLCGNTIQP